MPTRLPLFRTLLVLLAVLAAPFAASAQPARTDRGPELDTEKDYYALIVTNHGQIPLKLLADVAPITVRNFVNLAEGTREFRDLESGRMVSGRRYFDGLIFHRVIPDFMIQGGDPMGTGRGGPGYQFRDEFDPSVNFSKPGLLAMANSGPATNGSQFFITEAPTPHLNQRHTIFGEIMEGSGALEVVKEIARVPKGAQDRPVDPVVMERVIITRLDKGTGAAEALEAVRASAAVEQPAEEPAGEAAEEASEEASEEADGDTESAEAEEPAGE